VNRLTEAKVRARISLFGPRRMSLGARFSMVALVLFAVGYGAYNRYYVDQRVKVRIAQNCASWGADQALFDVTLAITAPTPLRDNSPAGVRRNAEFRASLVQARDTKIVLRQQNHCPPYPAAPVVPTVPESKP
jgi:hypothetical protein